MTGSIGQDIDRFLFPKGSCCTTTVQQIAGVEPAVNEQVVGQMRCNCNKVMDAYSLRKRRCEEVRAKKSPGEKLTTEDLTYIFDQCDDGIYAAHIALLIRTKHLDHPIFEHLRKDLHDLHITFDDIESEY